LASTTPLKRAPFPVEFYRSAIGKKWIMAITGIVWIVYLVAHMVGNWKIFMPEVAGVAAIDSYAQALRSLLYPLLPEHVVLWFLRTGLIVALLLHVHAAYALTMMNRRARPDDYQSPRTYVAANYASRTMRWSGTIVLFFIFFHLADLTWGIQPMAPEVWEHGAIYANFIATFSRPLVTVFYVVAIGLMSVHLYHGAWSMFQSLGWNHPRFNPVRKTFAVALAAFIGIGNVIMPLAVLFGMVG
jgi:succinate dehydrogenase / fumarate reductase, cytochrome b subunit